jgi:haloalkane dehalogenase
MDSAVAHNWVDRGAWPYEDRFVDLPEGRIHYVDEGSGPPVLLVHGTPTWAFEYRHLIRGLSDRYRCIAPDLLGFGLSERPGNFDYRPESHSRVIERFADRLGLNAFSLVVHDFGGPIALPLALDRPGRVRSLILMNTWMWSFEDFPDLRKKGRMVSGAFGKFMYRRLNASLRLITPSAFGDRRKLTPAIHQQYLAPFEDIDAREKVLWALARALNGSSSFYESLYRRRSALHGIPTLIIWGMADPAFKPDQLERWREVLPDARVVELERVGHWPHEEAPDAVVAEAGEFLGRVVGS